MATAVSRHSMSAPAGTTDIPAPSSTPRPKRGSELALSDLRLGTSGRVVGLLEDAASGAVIKRLGHLGFVPGRVVMPLRRAPLGDPVIYRVSEYELCLRRHEARLIHVEPVTEADDVVESAAEAETAHGTRAGTAAGRGTASARPVTEPAGEEQH